jgi:hypothetical protein
MRAGRHGHGGGLERRGVACCRIDLGWLILPVDRRRSGFIINGCFPLLP